MIDVKSPDGIAELHRLFAYDPETGALTRRVTINYLAKAGHVIATKTAKGYITVTVSGSSLYAHRIIWSLVHGQWPEHQIDHINRNPADNRLCNLRQVTHAENLYNSKVRKHNKLGIKGVSKTPVGRFAAHIRVKNQQIHIGTFDTAGDAEKARIAKEIELGIDHFVRPTAPAPATR